MGPPACPTCSATPAAPRLCGQCREAFRVAMALHPAASAAPRSPERPVLYEAGGADDIDLWDAWSLLGDVGNRR